ncbi:hypothetical protein THAOC_14478, partial [Thalassiosira oceanica]
MSAMLSGVASRRRQQQSHIAGYEKFQQDRNQRPSKNGRTKSVDDARTKTDTKNEACLELLRLAALLKETLPHLRQVRETLGDRDATQTHRKKLAVDMNKFDLPLIEKTIDIITKTAVEASPLPGMKEYHRKMYNNEKEEISQIRLSKDVTPVQHMITRFLAGNGESPRKPLPRVTKSVVTPRQASDAQAEDS